VIVKERGHCELANLAQTAKTLIENMHDVTVVMSHANPGCGEINTAHGMVVSPSAQLLLNLSADQEQTALAQTDRPMRCLEWLQQQCVDACRSDLRVLLHMDMEDFAPKTLVTHAKQRLAVPVEMTLDGRGMPEDLSQKRRVVTAVILYGGFEYLNDMLQALDQCHSSKEWQDTGAGRSVTLPVAAHAPPVGLPVAAHAPPVGLDSREHYAVKDALVDLFMRSCNE
jgi:hypothetical protein